MGVGLLIPSSENAHSTHSGEWGHYHVAMSEASNVALAFRDLRDAFEELSSGSVSPVAVRRNFTTFVDLSQKLTSYMRKEYGEKKGQTWVASDFDGWNDVTELFKAIRTDDQHERPISILVNETHYLRISEDTPDELAVSGTWSFSFDDQHLDTPRDDIIFELQDPQTGQPSGQRVTPTRVEYEFHLLPSSKKVEALLTKLGDRNVRSLSEKCFEVLSNYYQYYEDQVQQESPWPRSGWPIPGQEGP
jgi:hypothetical protein